MADTSRKDTELQRLLRFYLDNHPGNELGLADEFRTAVGTITRWANGRSRPARRTEELIISALQGKIHQELQSVLTTNLTNGLALELATEFQVATSTVKRWASGTARPHPRLAQMIINWVKSKSQAN